jgi:hypothetical protein
MKPKKSRFNFGPNGLKGFLIEHVEKFVLGLALFLVLVFAFMGSRVETFPASKTPETLASQVSNAKTHMNTNTWAEVQKELSPPPIDNPIVINTRPETWMLAHMSPPILPSRSKRRDPNLYPPLKPEVVAMVAAISTQPEENTLAPIDEKYLEYQEELNAPPPVAPVDDRKSRRRGRDEEELIPTPSMTMRNQPRELTESEREQWTGGRSIGQGTPLSRNIVAFKMLIPVKKQTREYLEALAGNSQNFNEERDRPNYFWFYIERADVTDNPSAAPADLKWVNLNAGALRALPYQRGAVWEMAAEELIDPAAVLAGLTLPVPPVLLADIKKLAGHSDIAFAADLIEEQQTNVGPDIPDFGPGIPGMDGPNFPPEFGTPGGPSGVEPGRGGPTPSGGPAVRGGPTPRGGPSPYGGGRESGRGGYPSSTSGGYTEREIDYQLLRIIDFDVQRGHQYRYRAKLTLIDPNHPPLAQSTGGTLSGDTNTNDPPPTSLMPDVEQRLRELEQEERKNKRRIFWRDTDWSEVSDIVTIPEPLILAAGKVTPAREGPPIPGTNIRVAVGEPKANVLVVDWNDLYAAHVAAEHEVERGAVMNFAADGETLHPTKLVFFKLKDYQFRTGAFVVDVRGGDRLTGGKRALDAPGAVALIDAKGNLLIQREGQDMEDWQRYGDIKMAPVVIADDSGYGPTIEPGRGGSRDRDLLIPGGSGRRGRE